MVEIGDLAPNAKVKMTTNDQVNAEVNLHDLYGEKNTVLYFFPAAFTGVCTKSSCQLRDDLKEFEELNANIYGLSTDMPFSQKVFREQNNINYPLLSDWNKEAIKSFGSIDDSFAGGLMGVAKRSLFLISENKIKFKWIAETPGTYPPFDELKQILKS